jgi:hypothetical protein
MKKIILLVYCNLLTVLGFSQAEFIIDIDKTTGNFTRTTSSIAGVSWVYTEQRTFDKNTGTYYFISTTPVLNIIGANVSTGAIVSSCNTNNTYFFEFDDSTNTIYALLQDSITYLKQLISIEPITGSYTEIGNTLISTSLATGNFSTFDPINHTYFFLTPSNILYSINATNGTILSSPTLVLAQGESIKSISFDNSTGLLYGVLNDYLLNKVFTTVINPTNGTIVKNASGTTLGGNIISTAVDEVNQQTFLLYFNNGYYLSTIDNYTDSVIHNVALSGLDIPSDNVNSLEFDNINNKLYALHWDNILEPVSTNEIAANTNIYIAPNPFFREATLHTNQVLNNAILTLYNSTGQYITKIVNINQESITIPRGELQSGLYYWQLTEGNKIIAADKLLITDY